MANCPQCGGTVKFDIESQQLKCMSCDGLFAPEMEDLLADPENSSGSEDANNGGEYEATVFICPQCGGELVSTEHDLSGNCSFCGSPVVFNTKMVRQKRPDYIIPFGITKNECKEAFIKEIKKKPFAPKELKDPEFIESFRGIYVPYWFYDVKQNGKFSFDVNYTEHHSTYSYVCKDRVSGQHNSEYKHIMHDASSVLHDDISEKTEPFETVPNPDLHRRSPELKKFSTGYFAGFYAEPADVPASTYIEYAKHIADDKTAAYITKHQSFTKYHKYPERKTLETSAEKNSLAMMPVWFLSYRKRNRVAYAAVNGQTGRVVSDCPIDFGIFTLKFLAAAAIFFILLMFATIMPVSVTLMSVIFAWFVTRYCHDDIKMLRGRADDEKTGKLRVKLSSSKLTLGIFIGVFIVFLWFKACCYVEPDAVLFVEPHLFGLIAVVFIILHIVNTVFLYIDLAAIKKDRAVCYFISPMLDLAAAFFGTAVLFAAPVEDYKYYLAGCIVIAVEMLSFIAIIRNYNRIATRPLPQFAVHKGGDDSAR